MLEIRNIMDIQQNINDIIINKIISVKDFLIKRP